MFLVHKDNTLERAYNEDWYYPPGIDRKIVDKALRIVRWITESNDFRVVLSHPCCDRKQKQGKLKGHYWFRVNDQWRLVIYLDDKSDPKKVVLSYFGKHYE